MGPHGPVESGTGKGLVSMATSVKPTTFSDSVYTPSTHHHLFCPPLPHCCLVSPSHNPTPSSYHPLLPLPPSYLNQALTWMWLLIHWHQWYGFCLPDNISGSVMNITLSEHLQQLMLTMVISFRRRGATTCSPKWLGWKSVVILICLVLKTRGKNL